mgnify:CR=1 FL=1
MEHSTLQGRFQARFFWTVLALLALAVFPLVAPALGLDFYISFVRRVLIYALAATSLNLILGYGGMVALGHAAFFGAGAYAVGILAMNGVTSALVAWPAAVMPPDAGLVVQGLMLLVCYGVDRRLDPAWSSASPGDGRRLQGTAGRTGCSWRQCEYHCVIRGRSL